MTTKATIVVRTMDPTTYQSSSGYPISIATDSNRNCAYPVAINVNRHIVAFSKRGVEELIQALRDSIE